MTDFFGRTAAWKRFKKLLERSEEKIDKSLDILKFIKSQRISDASYYALLPREERKFVESLAEGIISEYSTPSECCWSSDDELNKLPNPSKQKDLNYV